MQLGLQLPVPDTRLLGGLGTLRDLLPARPTTEELTAAVESGLIAPAFDLRAPGSDRALWRVWRPTITALIASAGMRNADCGMRTEEILDALVPRLDDVKSSSLERWWSLSPQHVHDLIAAGELPVRRRAVAAHGPGSYHLLARDGVRAFLASRLGGMRSAECGVRNVPASVPSPLRG